MEVNYTITLDDYVAYQLRAAGISPPWAWAVRLLVLFPVLFAVWTAIYANWRPAVWLCAVATMTAFTAWLVREPYKHYARVVRRLRAHFQRQGVRGLVGPITLILTEETLTECTETTLTVARWVDMERVDVVGDCTYIYVTGGSAAIVPLSGFERAEDYEAVRDFAVAKLTRVG